MTGRIIRIISNLYTVSVDDRKYLCHARGKFKNIKLTPLVGDKVEFDEKEKVITEIHNRKNELKRPMIANVDSCIIISSCKRPDFAPYLLDKMLTNVYLANIKPIICFSKFDLLEKEEQDSFKRIIDYYNHIGIPTFINTQIEDILSTIDGEVVVLTGQTGVGKSTLMNHIDSNLNLATDDISEALGRGKHTTRHVELFKINNTLIADTPGFSALDLSEVDKLDIRFTFKEFQNDRCKFGDCKHLNENGCFIKEEVAAGNILKTRYESYKKMVSE